MNKKDMKKEGINKKSINNKSMNKSSMDKKGKWKAGIACALFLLMAAGLTGCGSRAESAIEEETGKVESTVNPERDGEQAEGTTENVPAESAGGGISAGEPEEQEAAEKETEKEAAGEEKPEAAPESSEGSGENDFPWAGKKVSVCGDSISTFTGYIPETYSKFYPEYGEIQTVEETWWMQVVERTGMELCRNASYSGSMVSGQSLDDHDGAYACGNQRIADLASPEGEWPDVILILMGTNDFLSNIPLGSYDGVSQVQEGYIQNFSEAYGLMLDKMHAWYPDAEIYCCTMIEVSRWDEKGVCFPYQNELGLTAKNYNDCIKAVANAKGVGVIDVYWCGITYDTSKEYTSDGTHPNAAGAALMADKVCEGLGVDE